MVIIEMNINNSIEIIDYVVFFNKLNMHEAIVSTHKGKSLSATNRRNQSKYPIDGI